MKYLFSIVIPFIYFPAYSQCVMCKVAAEQSNNTSGINEGILYLMPLPALLIFSILGILYYNYRKKSSGH
jgi:hypothetical protein